MMGWLTGEIADLLKQNPLLLGGVGTVAFSSGIYFLRSIPGRIYALCKRMLTIEVVLTTSQSGYYHELLEVLSTYRIGAFARNYTSNPSGNIIAGFGNSIAVYGGRLIHMNRQLVETNYQFIEKLTLTVFSRDVRLLEALMEQARQPKADNTVTIYSNGSSPVKRKKRSLETIFVNGDIKERIIESIEWFRANEHWYYVRGIPYKRVILLHGPPGTGKTSLIFGIASHLGVNLASIESIRAIDYELTHLPANSFAVIEDIDMISVAREGSAGQAEVASPGSPAAPPTAAAAAQTEAQFAGLSALQILINTLDGIRTPHGMVVFITTNHKDRLDHALIRPGRIDVDLEIGPLQHEAARAMFTAFYGEIHAGAFDAEHYVPHTGAELQAIFLEETEPHRALGQLRHRAPALSVVAGP